MSTMFLLVSCVGAIHKAPAGAINVAEFMSHWASPETRTVSHFAMKRRSSNETENATFEPACPCVANHSALLVNGSIPVKHEMFHPGSGVDTVYEYPATYGASCAAHDSDLPPDCKDKEFAPAWCPQPWCYVDSECNKSDVKSTKLFEPLLEGKNLTLSYSYSNCEGIDFFTPAACNKRDEPTCASTSDCAWEPNSQVCMSEACTCSGGLTNGFGATCNNWDQAHCDDYGANPGLWCCMRFCFVEKSCPSAVPHPGVWGKYISYASCPQDAEALSQCPEGTEPVDAKGEPLPLTGEVATKLEEYAKKPVPALAAVCALGFFLQM